MEFFEKFYLDKEHDIIVNLYKKTEDTMEYIIETPNHKTGNLITNLARMCELPISRNDKNMKIIRGTIPASINADNAEVYILRLGGIKVANIYNDKTIELKAKIPAINKTLMSQTKDYKIDVSKTLVKSYILKKEKFRTDLHTHIHANLDSDNLIALGIKHQIKYSLYYIKKLGLKLSDKQANEMFKRRCEVEEKYKYEDLPGKKLIRKIDNETFINFADLILNNPQDMEENISKIRNSLVLMKDGQAVFTNLEKLYVYRYVFSKGKVSDDKIKITKAKIDKIPNKEIRTTLNKMMDDSESTEYKNNTLLQDKLLWVAREYAKQGIFYTEISVTWIVRKGEEGAAILQELHEILPKIEAETGVKLRFLGSFSRTLMTEEQLKEGLDVFKVTAKSPYVVGSDIIGEEINDISNFKQVLKELVEFAVEQDDGFTIRVHAGENDCLRSNVEKSIRYILEAVPEGKQMPRCRIGHGLYGIDVNTEAGQDVIKIIKENNVILEFQLTSNVRLNNLTDVKLHPIKKYLENGVNCVQGSDGCGIYGTDCMEEQLALKNLLDLTEQELIRMKNVENKLISENDKFFKIKQEKFNKWLNGREIKNAILEEELKEIENGKDREFFIGRDTTVDSGEVFKQKVVNLPQDKFPIIIAGGSFNTQDRKTKTNPYAAQLLEKLVEQIDEEKAYFVIGHRMQGYEKMIIDITKKLNKNVEIDAIVPKKIEKNVAKKLLSDELTGIYISPEQEELGIYKSFNYEIFERRPSVVLAFDGNSAVSNLVQEAKNGKARAQIYINNEVDVLKEKANYLGGYVNRFDLKDVDVVDKLMMENPEIFLGESNEH